MGAAAAANATDVYDRKGSLKDEPAYVSPTTWAGFYAGIHAGASFGDELELKVDGVGTIATDDVDSAFLGGVHVGYNWQTSPNWVFGVEAAISVLDDEIDDTDITDYLASIRGRLGYAFGNSLLYGTGGVAFLGYSDDFGGDNLDNAVGFVVGGGFEHKLSSNLSVGVESLYYSFSSDADVLGVFPGELDRDFWTVQARLNYHFNRGYDEPLK
jgi:outer membrane immunogenic protein